MAIWAGRSGSDAGTSVLSFKDGALLSVSDLPHNCDFGHHGILLHKISEACSLALVGGMDYSGCGVDAGSGHGHDGIQDLWSGQDRQCSFPGSKGIICFPKSTAMAWALEFAFTS